MKAKTHIGLKSEAQQYICCKKTLKNGNSQNQLYILKSADGTLLQVDSFEAGSLRGRIMA